MNAIVPLAEEFEKIETISIIKVLRRACIDVTTIQLDKNPVTGSHGLDIILNLLPS